MGSDPQVIPPPPAGFTIDAGEPPPPPGFTIDKPKQRAAPQPQEAGFWKSLGQGLNPVEGIKSGVRALGGVVPKMTIPGLHGQPQEVGGSGVDVYAEQKAGREAIQNKAAEDFAAGNTGMGALRSVEGSIPMIGSALEHISSQAERGNNAGAIGSGLATAINVGGAKLLPESVSLPEMAGTARKLYQKALSPTTKMLEDTNALSRRTEAGLSAGRLINKDSLANFKAEVRSAGQDVGNAEAAAGDVPKVGTSGMLREAEAAKKPFIGDKAAIRAMDRSVEGQLDTIRVEPGNKQSPRRLMTATEAQDMKRRLQGRVDYGHPSKTAIDASRKAQARGLAQDIANEFQDVADKNKIFHDLKDFEPTYRRAVAVAEKQGFQKPGIIEGAEVLGGLTHGVHGGIVGLGAAGATMLARRVLASPAVKSRIAVSLYRASGKTLSMPEAHAQVAGWLNQLGQEADDEQKRGQSAE